MSRLRRIADTDRIFFVTTDLVKGATELAPRERDVVLNALSEARDLCKFFLIGFVVMPDHAHAILGVCSGSLATVMNRWKARSGRQIQKARRYRGPLWQARYFDFICRRTRDVSNKLDYIHDNPVKAGLVKRAEDWRWSSAAFYAKTGKPPVTPDVMDFSGDPDELLWPAPWRK